MSREYNLPEGMVISGYSLVYMPEYEVVCISDLHLGFEVYMESEGLYLPRMQLKIEEERIRTILREYAPSTVLINGDIKQEFSRNTSQEWLEIKKLFSLITERCNVVVVKGNHDNYILNIAAKYGIKVTKSVRFGSTVFAHGDTVVTTERGKAVVIGHEHPAIRVVDSVGAYYKFPAFIYFAEDPLLILPAFSPFSLGTDVISDWHTFQSPYLTGREGDDATVFAVLNGEVRKLGRVSSIRAAIASGSSDFDL
ncbi:MAG: metallophosphoesterase [Thermoplasmata archaeon]|uniref:Metallophosphoesterase n=1 Tax=Candidatus Sysuiplasma superficiale TaxID=2823368 RepID=A0A8J8CDG8_9ARCH|nr:metallophosphoesterase [Candidatus Sysuiplasma superficiale]